MKLARLKMLKAFTSNFTLTRSVTLNILDKVMSAVQLPGPTNVFRPRLPVQPRQGEESVRTGPVVVKFDVSPTRAIPQPFAQLSCPTPLTPLTLEFGLSFRPRSRLKSPPTFVQSPASTPSCEQSPTSLRPLAVYGSQCAPLWKAQIPFSDHPPTTAPAKPLRFWPGSCHT